MAPGPADAHGAGVTPGNGPAADDPEVVLMLRVRDGDETAFPELFRRLAPRVYHYVRRLLGHDARAEEVTQDVFVQVYRFRDRWRPDGRLATWVFTIATNLCLNELRRPERQLRVDLWERRGSGESPAEELNLPDTGAVGPEEEAAGRQLLRALDAAVAALPPKQRAALLLSRIDGLAHRDVAAVLGSTEGAVKALLFRATQALKERLKDFL